MGDKERESAPPPRRLALFASPTPRGQEVAAVVRGTAEWCALEEADIVVVIGGDGTMLDALHHMIRTGRVRPVYGVNAGTVGFLMNRYHRSMNIIERLHHARSIAVSPLAVEAVMQGGDTHCVYAINELSLLRETRQTAKIEISVNGRVRIAELAGDGVLLATPVGSTAYNFSASGPILPLDSQMLALTPISPFRPRRWKGAILPDRSRVTFRVLEPDKRPVSAVADQTELRNIAEVRLAIAREREMTLLFDPGHALDERIVAEQFAH
ncbi:inorganic polyphosphate kinase [Croceibacterium mercuriale]|uniref:NAD kinase n=1 Tax=Croceibacterium mercuriale TaxID=1572751 RepID=A0A0B2C1G5_9SPHN|nr:NAD kinase [Croceibacterium mercuriale]KHL25786.1 inorganic polyphosphate kinase [Croceibacterium mercuriale]